MKDVNFSEIYKKAKNYEDLVSSYLSRIIKTPAMSNNEKDRIMLLKSMCEQIGFDEVKIDGLGNLLARIGNGPKKLVIDAHIDTVGVGDQKAWTKDPFSGEIKYGYIYGRGASDQLGGAASMLLAGKILKEMGYKSDKWSIWFSFTIIEEDCDGLCWKYLIESEKFMPDLFISTEPTGLKIYRGHRGRMEIEINLKGLSCHGSAPERGVSAAYMASRVALGIEKLNKELKPDKEKFLGKGTVTVSMMKVSGPSQCAVPDIGYLYLDRRLTTGETKELAIEQIEKVIKKYAGINQSEYNINVPTYSKPSWTGKLFEQELYFPTWKFDETHPFVSLAKKTYQELFEAKAVVDKWTFSTNATCVAGRYNIPSIGFGPGLEKEAHAPNEKIAISDLPVAAAFYAAIAFSMEDF